MVGIVSRVHVGLGVCRGEGTHAHVASICLWADLADQGDGHGLCKSLDGFGLELAVEDGLALVELLVENYTGLLDALGGC